MENNSLTENIEKQSFAMSPTGEHPRELSIRRTVKFARYDIEIELTESGKFLGIVSIKIPKDFAEALKSNLNPSIHDVEKYYREE